MSFGGELTNNLITTLRVEGGNFSLTLYYQANSHGLDTASTETWADLFPQHGTEFIAH